MNISAFPSNKGLLDVKRVFSVSELQLSHLHDRHYKTSIAGLLGELNTVKCIEMPNTVLGRHIAGVQ